MAEKGKGITKKKLRLSPVSVLIVAAGLCLILYPWLANAWNLSQQSAEIEMAEAEADVLKEEEIRAYFEAAYEYNEAISKNQAKLVDPFIGDDLAESAGDYYGLLDYSEDSVIGWIDIPSINVYLPVYHGTGSEVLQKGVGHLEGSSLPVGGESTRAVLTGHTGLSTARLFTDLTELKEGDWFYFHILGETLAYEVTEVEVALPEETDLLRVREGEDLMTLLTCTPYGINDHRLLVTGTRGEYTEEVYEAEEAKANPFASQWMRKYRNALLIAAAIIGCFAAAMAAVKRRKRKKRQRHYRVR